jgi:tetratricopeptide (TPR) repeat protein
VEAATVRRWLDLSLLQREVGQIGNLLYYSVHPVVREYLLGQVSPDARRELHTWAAAYHGQPFVEVARRAIAQSGRSLTDEEIEKEARSGAVRFTVAQTDNMAAARGAMDRALEWQHHLFAAGDYEAADDIVNAVWLILGRWGERDRAKALLRGSIETLEGPNKAVAQGNLANLRVEEGKLEEALAIYEEVYRTFEAMGAKLQMAQGLAQQGYGLWLKDEIDSSIEKYFRALDIFRLEERHEGQAMCLHQLSILYHIKGDYATSLAHSEEAEKLFRKLNTEAHVARALHQQGLILNDLADAAQIDEEWGAQRRAAFERFQQSLDIARRIGYEVGAADALGELGKLLRDTGQMHKAIAAFTEFTETHRRLGNPARVSIGLELLGTVHERQGQYTAALEKYQQSFELLRQYSSPQEAARLENHIVQMQAKLWGE